MRPIAKRAQEIAMIPSTTSPSIGWPIAALLAMAAAAALVPSVARAQAQPAAAITFDINQSVGQASVTGQVVTNGTIGTLTAADIVSWDLVLISGSASINLNSQNSQLFFQGTDLVASASELTFNFSGSGGVLAFQKVLFSGREYWCLQSSSGPCFQGQGIVPGDFRDSNAAFEGLSGVIVIGNTAFFFPDEAIALSFDDLADARFAQMINTFTRIQVLLGLNEQVSNCGNSGGGYVSFGSLDVATNGRIALNDEFTVLGGLVVSKASSAGIDAPLATGAAIALRYDPADMGSSRPFFELGASGSLKRMEIQRAYDTGTAIASGTSRADGHDFIAYARAGWVSSLGKRDELAMSPTITGMWQGFSAYKEAAGPDNPFPAIVPKGTDKVGMASLIVQYTHLVPSIMGVPVEFGLNGGVQHMFRQDSGIVAQVAGSSYSPERPRITYFQLGGRISARLSPAISAGVFVNSTHAPDRIGSGMHGGFGFRTLF